MDDFAEDTNPFQTDVDDIPNVTSDTNSERPPSPPTPAAAQAKPFEPPELPSKRNMPPQPTIRAYNQPNGYRTQLDLYLHSGEDVEIHVSFSVLSKTSSSYTVIDRGGSQDYGRFEHSIHNLRYQDWGMSLTTIVWNMCLRTAPEL